MKSTSILKNVYPKSGLRYPVRKADNSTRKVPSGVPPSRNRRSLLAAIRSDSRNAEMASFETPKVFSLGGKYSDKYSKCSSLRLKRCSSKDSDAYIFFECRR